LCSVRGTLITRGKLSPGLQFRWTPKSLTLGTLDTEINKMNFGDISLRITGNILRIARLEGDKYTFPEDPEAVIRYLRTLGKRVDIFTFLQKLPDTSPKYPYYYETDNLAVLRVTTFENWWNNQIRSYPRNRARQAGKRGVVMREIPFGEDLIRGICGIYNETPVRQGKKFPHYGMTLEKARKYAGTFLERSTYIGAFLGEEMIGFIKLTADQSRTQAALVHILSKIEHKDKAPTNALIAESVRMCAKLGVPYLLYEHFTYGNKVGDSLSHFKEVNGFQRMDVPRYYVPLTGLGRLALRAGLHHRITDRVPESVGAKIRELRRAWYERRFEVSEER
jgi:hypothetical protein